MPDWFERWLGGAEWRVTLAAVLIVVVGVLVMCVVLDAVSPYR